jgi:SAM-dependent methyltransferase/uncharacterized protein YbaR (Trm112 family)
VRRQHLDRLRPICPTCRAQGRPDAPIQPGTVIVEDDDDIREGVLICTQPVCQREHPIVDGIPIVVSDLASFLTHQLDAMLRREDLSAFTESLLGDAAGPGSVFERERATLGAYARMHWGDFDCEEPLAYESSLQSLVDVAFGLLSGRPSGTWVDLGCGVGRATREIARRSDDLAVGVDLSFAMLRVAERARRERRAVFPLRRVGMVFDRRDYALPDMPAERMSFWCCDVNNLPFSVATFHGALSLNVLDCVPSPLQHLTEMARALAGGAPVLLSAPYDWSPNATPLAQWIGGHSQRSDAHGSSAAELRRILRTLDLGLAIEEERDRVPWRVYVNERASMDYAVHMLRLRHYLSS